MRFLHTADWQLGMRTPGLGGAAQRVREARLEALRNLVARAREGRAEFMLAAGDLFEDNGVDRLLAQQAADILEGFGAPVYIIPGNHDPFAPGSIWEHPAWKRPFIRLLVEERPAALDGGTLYPCPLRQKHSLRNPTSWIPAAAQGDGVRIGLAHGAVEGVDRGEPEYPIPRDAAARLELDYLALGHWHSLSAFPTADGAPRMAYSGAHETTKFGERDSGNALLVEIAGPGAVPTTTAVRTGVLSWDAIEVEVQDIGDLDAAREGIEVLEHPETRLVELRLRGVLPMADAGVLEHIEQILHSRFLFGRLDTDALHPAPLDEAWLSLLPSGVLQTAASRLQEQAAGHGEAGQTAVQALLELYLAARETDA